MTERDPQLGQTYATRPSLFIRLRAEDLEPREIAWEEFNQKYSPVIAGFAHNLGARPHDVDDLIQDVMLGFFSHVPSFQYDPSKGRFRGYLKVCTFRALQKRAGQNAKFNSVPLENTSEDDLQVQQVWDEAWADEQLNRAIAMVCANYENNATFRAFELNVIQGKPAAEVARMIGLSVDSVYKAKERVTQALRVKLQYLEAEDG